MTVPGELDERPRLIAVLRQARRPGAERELEHLEENVRWLVRMGMPRAAAPWGLRWRIRILVMLRSYGEDAPLLRWLTQWGSFSGRGEWRPGQPGKRRAPHRNDQELLALLLTVNVGALPEDLPLRAEAQRVVREVLDGMSELHREALLLHWGEQLPVADIAAVMRCPEPLAERLLREVRGVLSQAAVHGAGF